MGSPRSRPGRWTPLMAAFALAALAGAGRAAKAKLAGWPEPSRLAATAMTEEYGTPRKTSPDSLTWYGTGAWKRTVVRRQAAGGDVLEQTVGYVVPAEKAARMSEFDKRVAVDRKANELTVRSKAESTNFLLANLADEVAAGFKTPEEARRFYARQSELSAAGKSSSYVDRLRFQHEPVTAPPRTQPSGWPGDSRWPWVAPPGTEHPTP